MLARVWFEETKLDYPQKLVAMQRVFSLIAPGHRNHIRTRAWLAKYRPCFHERPPFFQGIATTIGPFGRIASDMSKSRFGNLTREMRRLAAPIAERAPEAMNGHARRLHPAQEHMQRHARKRLIGALAGKNEFARSNRRERFKDRQNPGRERHAMLAPGLHASGGNRPDLALKIEFNPSGAKHLPRARRSQNREFECQRRSRPRARASGR